ncbi:hypothetical protein FJZ18_02565 [Candidatus Pacearchaeota archaeon]|nr:hypothetical protein [Candidatus Pacearchaeota archaeon]
MNNEHVHVHIVGECASRVEELPKVWQDIAAGSPDYRMRLRDEYMHMAQLFHHKLHAGKVDLYDKRTDLVGYKQAFQGLFGTLADEALNFYGHDFRVQEYPDFASIESRLNQADKDYEDKARIVRIGKNLFKEFGYDLPASFYHVHLAPLAREEVCEIRPLRFSEDDKQNARGWDASLHAQKVFPMQLTIQSMSSQEGFFWEHGCGCNHGLSRVGKADSAFSYKMRPEMRDTWIKDFVWTAWYEYAFFPFTPVTKYLTGNVVEFT